jgi:hypothetical protein
MKLPEIIEKANEITLGSSMLFIASENFNYGQLPILKDSLVYYDDYKKTIAVNMIEFGLFQKKHVETFKLKNALPEKDRNYIVEKNSNCNLEVTTLDSLWRGIWHQNHFDNWNKYFSDHINRIKNEPSLQFSGITFSSLMYNYNIATNSLLYFINTRPYEYQTGNGKIVLPELIEIDISPTNHGLVSSVDIEYFDIKIEANSLFDFNNQTGILSCMTANEFEGEVVNHPEIKKIIVSQYNPLRIDLNGTLFMPLTTGKMNKVDWFKVIKNKH